MKLNISSNDCKYIVDKDKRKIICIIDNTEHLFLNFVYSNFEIGIEDLGIRLFCYKNINKRFLKKFHMPKRFVGVATCSEADDWNEDTGKLIAYSRAKDNLNKSFFKRANLYINSLDKEIDKAAAVLDNLGYKLSVNTNKRHKKIASLVGEE